MATCKKCDKKLGANNKSGFCGKHWKEGNKELVRKLHRADNLKRKRGVTIQEYDHAFDKQNGKCALCREQLTNTGSVDHNHATGKFRGILCIKCNAGLGMFKDSIDILKKAHQYLVSYGR